jgi:UDP-N-acetylglucosamine 3-dehydrogenase
LKVRVGIAGLGRIGERHLNAYSRMENVEIRGYCDNDNALVKQYSKLLKATPFSDLNSLVESDEVDAIDVCLPTVQHHEVILKALQNKKHVFCEKPLTHKLEYAEEIKRKAEEQGGILMVGYLYRFHPSFELLQDVLSKGVIGKPYYAIFRIGGRGGHRAWKHQLEKGGGACVDMLTHMLDLALSYFGEPAEIEPLFSDIILKDRLIDGEKVQVDAEDCTLARLKTKTGVQVFLLADLITPSFMNSVEVHGDNGSFLGSIVSRFPTVVYCKEPRDIYDRGENVFSFPPTNLIEKELRYFVSCILNSGSPQNSIDDSIKILQVIEELRRQQNG